MYTNWWCYCFAAWDYKLEPPRLQFEVSLLGWSTSQDHFPVGTSDCGASQMVLVVKNPPANSKWVKVAQSCLTLCDPMDYPVHGILQARMLEWVAFPFSGDLPNPGIKPLQPGLPHCRQILYQLNHKGRWRHVGSIPGLRIPWTEEPGISKSRTWLKQLNMHTHTSNWY